MPPPPTLSHSREQTWDEAHPTSSGGCSGHPEVSCFTTWGSLGSDPLGNVWGFYSFRSDLLAPCIPISQGPPCTSQLPPPSPLSRQGMRETRKEEDMGDQIYLRDFLQEVALLTDLDSDNGDDG